MGSFETTFLVNFRDAKRVIMKSDETNKVAMYEDRK
jgi:hypothetical protein